MDNAVRFLKRTGQDCTINGTAESKAHVKMATQSVVVMRHGIILPDAGLKGGDILNLAGDELLVQTTLEDYSGVSAWYGIKVNCAIDHQSAFESADEHHSVIVVWNSKGEKKAFGQLVTMFMRETDPGLLPTTKSYYIMDAGDIEILDRFVVSGENLQVDDVDDMFLPGLVRVQCSADTRG